MLTICRSSFRPSIIPYSSRRYMHHPKVRIPLDLSVYLIANKPSYPDEAIFFSRIKKAVEGGVSCVQLRDHDKNFNASLETAHRLRKLLNGVPFFINTYQSLEIAEAVQADGVFLEIEKSSYPEARKRLGHRAIIGIPAKTMDDILAANQTDDIDYLSVKIAPSKRTCPKKNDEIWDEKELKKIRRISMHRLVVVGGLTPERMSPYIKFLNPEMDGLAMASGIMGAEDPYLAVKTAAKRFQEIHKVQQQL